jgi:hypothetical protein
MTRLDEIRARLAPGMLLPSAEISWLVAEVDRLTAREKELMADLEYARAYLAWYDSENPAKTGVISTENQPPHDADEDLHED